MLHAPVTKPATPAQIDQRSYTVARTPQPSWSLRKGLDWTVRRYGKGNDWTHCHGEVSMHSTEAGAHEFGRHWVVAGRAL